MVQMDKLYHQVTSYKNEQKWYMVLGIMQG